MLETLTKAVDLLKASFWQAAMIAIACLLLIYLNAIGLIPAIDSIVPLLWVIAFVSGGLAIAAEASDLDQNYRKWRARAREERERSRAARKLEQSFRDYVPFLTDKDRQILGYLLHKKQKTFLADDDGGHASTLLARGFVKYIGVGGQRFDIDKVPMAIPDHVWKVLEEQPECFPYTPEYSADHPRVEVHPWRMHWMER
jgi:hypothetical protein